MKTRNIFKVLKKKIESNIQKKITVGNEGKIEMFLNRVKDENHSPVQ